MNVRKAVLGSVVGLGLFASGVIIAQRPERDVSRFRHPNISAAQHLVDQAYAKIVAAQEANEWDMNGHAQKAKDYLDKANHELKEAAEAANHR